MRSAAPPCSCGRRGGARERALPLSVCAPLSVCTPTLQHSTPCSRQPHLIEPMSANASAGTDVIFLEDKSRRPFALGHDPERTRTPSLFGPEKVQPPKRAVQACAQERRERSAAPAEHIRVREMSATGGTSGVPRSVETRGLPHGMLGIYTEEGSQPGRRARGRGGLHPQQRITAATDKQYIYSYPAVPWQQSGSMNDSP